MLLLLLELPQEQLVMQQQVLEQQQVLQQAQLVLEQLVQQERWEELEGRLSRCQELRPDFL